MKFGIEEDSKGNILLLNCEEYPYSLLAVQAKTEGALDDYSLRCHVAPYVVSHICSGEKGETIFAWDIEANRKRHEELRTLIAEVLKKAVIFLDNLEK